MPDPAASPCSVFRRCPAFECNKTADTADTQKPGDGTSARGWLTLSRIAYATQTSGLASYTEVTDVRKVNVGSNTLSQ